MSKINFEQLLAIHCAPTFKGLRVGNLISFKKDTFSSLQELFDEYLPCFACKGIAITVLAESEHRLLVFFYRRKQLMQILSEKHVLKFLSHLGYQKSNTLDEHLNFLRTRATHYFQLTEQGISSDFPHEMGLFLGYPYEDVIGFIKNHGKKFSFSGYWKVYAHEKETRQLFQDYTSCTLDFCQKLNNGTPIEELLEAVG